jgi:hypothetical protein
MLALALSLILSNSVMPYDCTTCDAAAFDAWYYSDVDMREED